jgi:hypothetical protein
MFSDTHTQLGTTRNNLKQDSILWSEFQFLFNLILVRLVIVLKAIIQLNQLAPRGAAQSINRLNQPAGRVAALSSPFCSSLQHLDARDRYKIAPYVARSARIFESSSPKSVDCINLCFGTYKHIDQSTAAREVQRDAPDTCIRAQ